MSCSKERYHLSGSETYCQRTRLNGDCGSRARADRKNAINTNNGKSNSNNEMRISFGGGTLGPNGS